MSETQILQCTLVLTLVCAIFWSRLSYKTGVWDGAFNQFLPKVQKHMREYDERRANEILVDRRIDQDRDPTEDTIHSTKGDQVDWSTFFIVLILSAIFGVLIHG